MTKPAFMSQQHVDEMNRRLAADADSRAECAKLARSHWLSYELAHERSTVWWSVEFSPRDGVRFSLAPPASGDPQVLLRGDYRAVVEATRRQKEGLAVAEPVTMHGDPGVIDVIGPAFAAAGRAATIATEFPEF